MAHDRPIKGYPCPRCGDRVYLFGCRGCGWSPSKDGYDEPDE